MIIQIIIIIIIIIIIYRLISMKAAVSNFTEIRPVAAELTHE